MTTSPKVKPLVAFAAVRGDEIALWSCAPTEREVKFIPALDSATFIPWGQSSSDLSKHEMSDLIEFMFAWGADHGVVWSDPPADLKRQAGRAA